MKVEKLDSFTRFTITVESEGEAMCLWHRLNLPDSCINEYVRDNRESTSVALNDTQFSMRIFSELDKVYNPRK